MLFALALRSLLAFIDSFLPRGDVPRRNNLVNIFLAILPDGINDGQQAYARKADDEVTVLFDRPGLIVLLSRVRVRKGIDSIIKGDAALSLDLRRFLLIPLESHITNIHIDVYNSISGAAQNGRAVGGSVQSSTFRLRARAVRRKDCELGLTFRDDSIVMRTRVLGCNSNGSSGRNT